jgi:M6 family metalloprotease-like protein
MSLRRACCHLIVCYLLIANCSASGQTADAQPLPVQTDLQSFEGVLNVIWGDPHPELGIGGETRYTLAMPDGTNLPLQFPGQENAAVSYFGKRVTVSGRLAPNLSAAMQSLGLQAVVVESILLVPSPQEAQTAAEAAVSGTRKVIFLLLKFSDDTTVPHVPSFYTDMTNPDTPPAGAAFPTTINGFYKKTSWNQFSWIGDVGGQGGIGAPAGWLALPNPKSYYANCGWSSSCANLTQLSNDGMALGRAQGINFSSYDNINFVLSNDLDCCAWGGSTYGSVEGKSFGATWEPPWGQETGTYAHEMGHSIGLPHSGWVYFAYDSPWDIMSLRRSASSTLCATYVSKNSNGNYNVYCTEPGDGFIAPYKDFLGWIPSGNQIATDTVSRAVATLESDAVPLSSAAKMMKICINGLSCTGSTAHYFTVEARVKGLGATSQYDNGIPGEGIIIHEFQKNRPSVSGTCFFNNQSGWAWPVDATPGDYDSVACGAGGRSFPNYALYNAQFPVGQTYTNSTYGFKLKVLSRSGSSFLVALNSTAATFGDFDGDSRSDITVYRPGTGDWYSLPSNAPGTFTNSRWGGTAGDVVVAGDYDGDGKMDRAIWRPGTGVWYVLSSSAPGTYTAATWGQGTDLLVPADYDGDGKQDIAVWRPGTGTWYILPSGTAGSYTSIQWGVNTDVPVPGDYDGDGKTDNAVWRPATGMWYVLKSSSAGSYTSVTWGTASDIPIPGDYDGDGKTDVAVWRPSTGQWFVLPSGTPGTYIGTIWGSATDVPVPGDYDGDRKTDIAVWRPGTGTWYILPSGTPGTYGATQWGTGTDTPISAITDVLSAAP